MTTDRSDESDDRMFTDSFAPQAVAPDSDQDKDELDEIEDLLPKAEPTEGTAPLP